MPKNASKDGATTAPDNDAEIERRRFAQLLVAGALTAYMAPFPYVLYQFCLAPAERRKLASPLQLEAPEKLFARQSYYITKFGDRNIIVRQTPSGLRALDMRCTHAGCVVEWRAENEKFVCRCHGGEFHADGSVAKLPPTEPLEELTVKIENGVPVVYDTPSQR